MKILYQDPHLVAVEKPAGFQVHQPEDQRHRVSRQFDCLYLLRKQIDQYLYPVHRLDRATSGVLLFALSTEAASKLSEFFQTQQIRKTYYCLVRGWAEPKGIILHPIDGKDAETHYERVACLEVPDAVGRNPRHSTTRYSLVRAEPKTGRRHQIRRHLAHLSHPLIGDTIYGDHPHNVYFREKMDEKLLYLKAYSVTLPHPVTGETLHIHSRWNSSWHKVFDWFGVCPFYT